MATEAKTTYISYDEYMKKKRSVKFYNLGLASLEAGNQAEASKYFNMTLLVNPFDVDATMSLRELPQLICLGGLTPAKQCLKSLGICYGR